MEKLKVADGKSLRFFRLGPSLSLFGNKSKLSLTLSDLLHNAIFFKLDSRGDDPGIGHKGEAFGSIAWFIFALVEGFF